MIIPSQIKIIGRVYEIIFDEKLSIDKDAKGEIRYREQKIYLMPDVVSDPRHYQSLEITLMHEILHGILHSTGYHKLRDDDTFVVRFSEVFYQVFNDYLDEHYEERRNDGAR